MRKLDNRKFDFYYFGGTVDQAEKDGANGVMVDFNSPEMPGMVEQLKKKKIDIAFLWSNCQETYSYVQVDYLEVENNIVKERNVFENYFHKCLSKSLK